MLVAIVGTSCGQSNKQPIAKLESIPLPIVLPTGYFSDASWVNDGQIALVYSEKEPDTISNQVLIVDMKSTESYLIPYQLPEECLSVRANVIRLRWLKENLVAFLLDCGYFQPKRLFDTSIYTWDTITKKAKLLRQYPPSFGASDFAFSPDLAQGLQEEKGDGIFNQLYSVDSSGNLQQVLPDHARVGSPDWSLDGKKIAFAATPLMPKQRTNLFSGLPGIDSALAQPWTIYVANPDFSEMVSLVENVIGVRGIQFSPDSRYLVFNAEAFQGTSGVFAASLNNGKIVELWHENVDFNLSPSGNTLMIQVDDTTSDDSILIKPVLLDLSDLQKLLQ